LNGWLKVGDIMFPRSFPDYGIKRLVRYQIIRKSGTMLARPSSNLEIETPKRDLAGSFDHVCHESRRDEKGRRPWSVAESHVA
jgi:hypothetical protein